MQGIPIFVYKLLELSMKFSEEDADEGDGMIVTSFLITVCQMLIFVYIFIGGTRPHQNERLVASQNTS